MYRHLSGLRFVETRISPLLPIFGAHNRILLKLRSWNGELFNLGQVDKASAKEFHAVLGSHEATLQALEANVKFLVSRVVSTVQMVSTRNLARCPLPGERERYIYRACLELLTYVLGQGIGYHRSEKPKHHRGYVESYAIRQRCYPCHHRCYLAVPAFFLCIGESRLPVHVFSA